MATKRVSEKVPSCHKVRPLRGAAKLLSVRARGLELRVWKLLEVGRTPTEIAAEVCTTVERLKANQSVHRIKNRVDART